VIRLQELELFFGHTHVRTNGWTDRRDVGNSILDLRFNYFFNNKKELVLDHMLAGFGSSRSKKSKGVQFLGPRSKLAVNLELEF